MLTNYRDVRLGTHRSYFYDADTGEELYAAHWLGNDESGIWKGARYTDTTLGVQVADFHTLIGANVTADFFPGKRIIVKMWLHGGDDIRVCALVDRARGWSGNEACEGIKNVKTLGIKLPKK